MQSVQNTLCRMICRLPKYSRISNERKKLHWLPVEYRIQFKLLLLAYKALNTNQPPYLRASLQQYSCDRTTRRSNPANKILKVPSFQHKAHKSKHHFNLTFEYAVPTLWNSLPINVSKVWPTPLKSRALFQWPRWRRLGNVKWIANFGIWIGLSALSMHSCIDIAL